MKNLNRRNTLIIGIGNSGRKDDGLGWACIESIDALGFFKGKTILRYQLQVEDAELISHYKQVLFVDAHQGYLKNGFSLKRCHPFQDYSFSTHEVTPSAILFLCDELYGKQPCAYTLAIAGDEWGLDIGLSEIGRQNLAKALDHLQSLDKLAEYVLA